MVWISLRVSVDASWPHAVTPPCLDRIAAFQFVSKRFRRRDAPAPARYTPAMNSPPSAPVPGTSWSFDDDPGPARPSGRIPAAPTACTVEAVGDGAAMRRALANGLPGAIVLDLMLPGEDGLSLARELRNHATLPTCRS